MKLTNEQVELLKILRHEETKRSDVRDKMGELIEIGMVKIEKVELEHSSLSPVDVYKLSSKGTDYIETQPDRTEETRQAVEKLAKLVGILSTDDLVGTLSMDESDTDLKEGFSVYLKQISDHLERAKR